MKKKIILLLASLWIIMINAINNPTAFAQEWFWDASLVNWYTVPWTNTIETWETETGNVRLIKMIKNIVNRVLGILSLIALILCLRWGFQMLTAAWDDNKVKSGTKILKQAAIWLAVIWISWILVSFIFRLIDKFTTWV